MRYTFFASTAPTFLDSQIGAMTPKSGYNRAMGTDAGSPVPIPAGASASSTGALVYVAVPSAIDKTGVRGFAGDTSGVICTSGDGSTPPNANGGVTPTTGTCDVLR